MTLEGEIPPNASDSFTQLAYRESGPATFITLSDE